MSPKKTATLNLRIDPILKEAAREAALRDQRSVANMIEVLIRRHCEVTGHSETWLTNFPKSERMGLSAKYSFHNLGVSSSTRDAG